MTALSGNHGPHQRLGFLHCDALSGLCSSWLQLLFVGPFVISFDFNKRKVCSIWLKSGDWLGHFRIFHFWPSKTPGFFCCMFLGHRKFLLWSAIQSTLLHLAESGQKVYPYTLQGVTQCHWKPRILMPLHCSTMFYRWFCMVCIMSSSKPSAYFLLPIILIQVDVNFSHPKNAFPVLVWLL